jgi:hypothetical protein
MNDINKEVVMAIKRVGFLLVAVVLCFGFLSLSNAEAACKSPNGFSSPQCTWYVDGKTANNGWTLKFAGSKGDAYKWYEKGYIKNATQGTIGYPGDIMVFNKNSSIKNFSHGHVAYIVNRGYWKGLHAWTVRHSNWGTGFGQWIVPSEKPCGITITQCTFVEYKSGWVKIQSGNSLGSTGYPLRGFLYKK